MPKFKFPSSFTVDFTENHLSNKKKSTKFFEEIVFPYIDMTKCKKIYPKEQRYFIIMGTFKGQDTDILKELCSVNNCETGVEPYNLTSKFLPLKLH